MPPHAMVIFHSLYTTNFDPSCVPFDISTSIQYHISRSNFRRGNLWTYFKCCFPSVVTHGRRWHQELWAGEKGTHHAQTPVASSMETVPGSYLSLEHVRQDSLSHATLHCISVYLYVIATLHSWVQYCTVDVGIHRLCCSMTGHQWSSWLGEVYSCGAWESVVCHRVC